MSSLGNFHDLANDAATRGKMSMETFFGAGGKKTTDMKEK